MSGNALARADDVAAIWRSLSGAESDQVDALCAKASARLRQKCPFDIDERIALFTSSPTDPRALDPMIVADVVANIVKRVLVNPDGATSVSETAGPFSRTRGFGAGWRGAAPDNSLRILESDIDQLRPAQPSATPATLRLGPGIAADSAFQHGDTYEPPWRSAL
jgi:hypothetical protein